MTKEYYENTELGKVILNLGFYLHPELIVDVYKDKFGNVPRPNKIKLEEYNRILSSIDFFVKKIKRYEYYFINFYPENEKIIADYEVLEYHIHSFIQDLGIIRFKLKNYIGKLKNDVLKNTNDKKEFKLFYQKILNKIDQTFKNVSEHRDPHVHGDFRFSDKYINEIQISTLLLDQHNSDIIKLTEYGVSTFKDKKEKNTINGKNEWAEKAKNNYINIRGFSEEIISNTRGQLFNVLNAEYIDTNELIKTKKD